MNLILEKFVRVFCLAVKKASFNSYFVFLILFVVFLLLLIIIFLNPLKDVLNSAGDKSCNSFFKTKSFFSKYGVDISFSQSKNFCDVSFVNIPSSYTDSEIETFVADSMIDCWNTYGRGSTELFHNTGSNYYCVLCSYISFEDKNKKINDFNVFLRDNYVPFYPYTDYSYIEFLANCDLNDCNGDFYSLNLKNNDFSSFDSFYNTLEGNDKYYSVIDTSKNYGVLYLIYEKNALIKKLDALKISSSVAVGSVIVAALIPASIPIIAYGAIATVSGVSSGKVLFDFASKDPEWNAGVVVLPYEDVKTLGCENVERISSNS